MLDLFGGLDSLNVDTEENIFDFTNVSLHSKIAYLDDFGTLFPI